MTQNPEPQYVPQQYPPAAPKKKNGLVKTLGIVAAVLVVLCCGIGTIALATSHNTPTGTARTPATTAAAVVPTSAAAVVTTHAAPPPAPPSPKVLLTAKGSGIKKTATFNTGAEWTLAYSYDCSNFGDSGNFAVTEYTNGSMTDILVNELDKGGQDSVPQHDDPGTHYLEINSECKWTITVTG